MKAIEVGDLVVTDHGPKMVVDVYRSYDKKQILLSCVDAEDNAELGDVWLKPMTYTRTSVVPVFHPENDR